MTEEQREGYGLIMRGVAMMGWPDVAVANLDGDCPGIVAGLSAFVEGVIEDVADDTLTFQIMTRPVHS